MPFLPPNQQRQSTEGIYHTNDTVIADSKWFQDKIGSSSSKEDGSVFELMSDGP